MADDDDSPQAQNSFKNDGSFLEVFKRLQQQQEQTPQKSNSVQASSSITAELKSATIKSKLPIIGKRKTKKLKTGVVKKVKLDNDKKPSKSTDSWSLYLEEVKHYQETVGEQDNNRRSLVK